MHRVKNKKVIKHLTLSFMKENRKKNRIILFAIMLTNIMFTSLFSIAASINENSQQSTMRQVGSSSMASVKYLLPEEYEKLAKDEAVLEPSVRILVADAQNEELAKLSTEINYSDDANAKASFCMPTTGRMPKEHLEIATSTQVLDFLGIPRKLGASVPLEFTIREKRYKQTFTLCGYFEGDSVAMAQQCFVSKSYCDEVAHTPEKTYLEAPDDNLSGYLILDFNFSNSWNIEKKVKSLLKRNGFDPDSQNYGINWAYTSSIIDSDDIISLLQSAIILGLILLSGYLIIYNVFYINIAADIQSYGLLKTIGTTHRQIKRMIHWQAFILCILSIPLGLLTGTGISFIILPAVMRGMEISFAALSANPFIYLLSVIFTFFTVWLSLLKPCRMAGKVSPVEAASYIQETNYRKKRKRTHRVNPFSMGASNLSRSRRKAIVIILSLSLSLILLNSVYSIINSFDADQYIATFVIGDFTVTHSSINNMGSLQRETAGVTEKDQQAFQKLSAIESISNIYFSENTTLHMNDTFSQTFQAILDRDKKMAKDEREMYESYITDKILWANTYGVDTFVLDNLAPESGEIDPKKFASGKYAIINPMLFLTDDEKTIAEIRESYPVGDTITLTLPNGTKKSYEIMAIAEMPYALSCKFSPTMGADVILPADEFLAHTKEKGALHSVFNVKKGHTEQVTHFLEEYTNKKGIQLDYNSRQTYLDEFENYIRLYGVIGTALSLLLMMTGILNFVNSIISSMLSRRQEFAILEAIGMTRRQLAIMSVSEGILYAFFTILFSVCFVILLSKTILQSVLSEIWFFDYHFTLLPIMGCSPFLLLLACLIPLTACRGMKKRYARLPF